MGGYPDLMRPRLFPVTLLAFVVLVACVPSSGPRTTADEPSPVGVASPDASLDTPEASLPIAPSDDLAAEPSATPIVEPSVAAPSASSGSTTAEACSGSDQNRDFFIKAAASLDWTVYCAVLPARWFVDAGEYRQAGGGRVEITYRGPGGARFELHEGAFCAAADGCVPSGADVGDAAFGDQSGTLIATDDGGWALVVEAGAPISWLAIGTGVDEDAFRAFTAGLAVVDG